MNQHTTRYASGTASYRAPEVISNYQYSNKVDVWAIGCIYFELTFRQRAFPSDYAVDQYARRSAADITYKLELPFETPQLTPIVGIIYETLNRNPSDRPSAAILLKRLDSISDVLNEDGTLNPVSDSVASTRVPSSHTIDLQIEDSSQSRNPSMLPNGNFMVPYRRNEQFIGRQDLLTKLRAKLSSSIPNEWNHCVALYGLGGVGKTQLALEYVYAEKSNYDMIFWIPAVSEDALLSGFQQIAVVMGCVPQPKYLTPAETAQVVLSWLNRQISWLLVFDNLDQVAILRQYLPERSPKKHVLVTTRLSYCHQIPAEGLHVAVPDIDSASDLLFLRSGISKPDRTPDVLVEGVEIVKELGNLPLAIEQAAAYIREASKDIFKFLPSYRTNRKRYHARASLGNLDYYSETVATTWRLSFLQIEKTNLPALQLMKLLAFLNPDGILVEFLQAGQEGLPDELREIVNDEIRFYEALGDLERFSLIRRDQGGTGQVIIIHRLVQSVIKDELSDASFLAMTEALAGMCDRAFPFQNYENSDAVVWGRRYLNQIVMPLLSVRSVKASKLLQRVGRFLVEAGKYQEAKMLFIRVLEIVSTALASPDCETVEARRDLARIYFLQGQHILAIDLLQDVLKTTTALFGEDHVESVLTMSHLSTVYGHQRMWDKAIEFGEKSLKWYKSRFGEEHSHTLIVLGNLAIIYSEQGRQEDIPSVIQILKTVADISQRVQGNKHPRTLQAKSHLAVTYRRQGRLDDACKLEEWVLGIRIGVFGEEHSDTLSAKSNLAATYQCQGRLEDASKLEEQVLRIRINEFGDEHPNTLLAKSNLAAIYREQGRLDDASKLGEQVLRIRINVFGEEHPDTLWAKSNLAATYREQGRLDASKLEEQVLGIRINVFGEEHPDTLWAKSNLAIIYRYQGRLNDACELEEQVLGIRINVFGEEHPNTLWTKSNLAIIYRCQGRLNDACELEEQILEIRIRVFGEEHLYTCSAMLNLAATHKCKGQWVIAAQFAERTLILKQKLFGEHHLETLLAMEYLGAIYSHQGRLVEAVKLEEAVLNARMRILGEGHLATSRAMSNLGETYYRQRRYADAESLQHAVLNFRRELLGADHPHTLSATSNLACTYRDQGMLDESKKLLESLVEIQARVLGEEHYKRLQTTTNLALVYLKQSCLERSISLLELSSTSMKKVVGENHPDTLWTSRWLALAYRASGRALESAELLRKVLLARTELLGPKHPYTVEVMNDLEQM